MKKTIFLLLLLNLVPLQLFCQESVRVVNYQQIEELLKTQASRIDSISKVDTSYYDGDHSIIFYVGEDKKVYADYVNNIDPFNRKRENRLNFISYSRDQGKFYKLFRVGDLIVEIPERKLDNKYSPFSPIGVVATSSGEPDIDEDKRYSFPPPPGPPPSPDDTVKIDVYTLVNDKFELVQSQVVKRDEY